MTLTLTHHLSKNSSVIYFQTSFLFHANCLLAIIVQNNCQTMPQFWLKMVLKNQNLVLFKFVLIRPLGDILPSKVHHHYNFYIFSLPNAKGEGGKTKNEHKTITNLGDLGEFQTKCTLCWQLGFVQMVVTLIQNIINKLLPIKCVS